MSKKSMSKRKKIRLLLLIVAVVIVVGSASFTLFIQPLLEEEEWVYKEAAVEKGILQVGVTESGSVTLEETTQMYDLDVSTDEDDDDDDDDDDEDTTEKYLRIENVYVAVGQRISEGDAIYQFTQDSVEDVRKALQYYKTEKEIALAQAQTEYEIGVLTASLSYDETVLGSNLADSTYQNTVAKLQTNLTAQALQIENLLSEILDLQIGLVDEEYYEQKQDIIEAYDEALDDLTDDIDDFFTNSIEAQVAYHSAKNSYDNFFSRLDQTNEDINDKIEEVYRLQESMENTKQLLSKEMLSASQKKETAVVSGEIADSKYNSSIRSYQTALEDAQAEVDTATEKLEDFEAFVGDGTIYAQGSGLVTTVGYEVDDKLETEGVLLGFAKEDDMTISVDVSQEDVVTMVVGDSVEISFTAYEDEIYEGIIQSITTTATSSDAATVSYPVVISIKGDTSKIYGGMTADVTFVTEQSEEVIYISKKAVVEENGKQYVYQKKGNAYALTQITTGFTDGVNIEVTSGLSEGDAYYIASVVTAAAEQADSSEDEVQETQQMDDSMQEAPAQQNNMNQMPGGDMPSGMGGAPQ